MTPEFRVISFTPSTPTLAMFATALLHGHVRMHNSFSLAEKGDWIVLISGDTRGLQRFREKMGKRLIDDRPISRPISRPTVGPVGR